MTSRNNGPHCVKWPLKPTYLSIDLPALQVVIVDNNHTVNWIAVILMVDKVTFTQVDRDFPIRRCLLENLHGNNVSQQQQFEHCRCRCWEQAVRDTTGGEVAWHSGVNYRRLCRSGRLLWGGTDTWGVDIGVFVRFPWEGVIGFAEGKSHLRVI